MTDSPNANPATPWLTAAEGAEFARCSVRTIYSECRARRLRHARVGGRRDIRLKAEWISAWLESTTQPIEVGRDPIVPPLRTREAAR